MKKLVIALICLLTFFVLVSICSVLYYKSNLKAVGTDKQVTFVVEQGKTTAQILKELENEGLIKSELVGKIYLKLNKGYSPQAGSYELNTNMTFEEIMTKLSNGDVIDNSIKITFVEGKRLTYFATEINKKFPAYSEESILNKLNDREFIKTLIDKYWFLTDDILKEGIYYPLEGYLFPSTYQIKEDATIEDIIYKLLDTTGAVLNKNKEAIEKSKLSIHQIMTLASIVELEGASSNDRAGVAGVFYNRLNNNWSLGSDVTTYYGAKVDMAERELYQWEIDQVNDYNTRPASMAGKLPIGPICNPGSDSINATINPTDHNYFFFVADKNGKTYFNVDYAGHNKTIQELKQKGLWYEY
jgi:UPF0755 protein